MTSILDFPFCDIIIIKRIYHLYLKYHIAVSYDPIKRYPHCQIVLLSLVLYLYCIPLFITKLIILVQSNIINININ